MYFSICFTLFLGFVFIVFNQAYGLARPKRASATKLLVLPQNCRILNEDFLKLVLKNRANKSVQILIGCVDFFFFRTFFFFEYAKQKERKVQIQNKNNFNFSSHHFFGRQGFSAPFLLWQRKCYARRILGKRFIPKIKSAEWPSMYPVFFFHTISLAQRKCYARRILEKGLSQK